ncbi:hypothetical protein TrRE_jg6893, partial [Triparma retinervis]
MAMTALPAVISYSSVLNVSPLPTLMSAAPGMLSWAFLATSPNMMSGITAVTAQLAYDDLYDPSLSQSTYVSHLLKGFKWGASAGIFFGALPNALFKGGNKGLVSLSDFFSPNVIRSLSQTPGLNKALRIIVTFFLGLAKNNLDLIAIAVFAVSYFIIAYLPPIYTKAVGSKPPSGMTVILASVLATGFVTFAPSILGYPYPGTVVGSVPISSSVLPTFDLTSTISEVQDLLQYHGWVIVVKAFVFSAISYLSVLSILPALPPSDHANPERRNLIAQGVSCIFSGAFGGPPVGASLSRSMVSVMMDVTSNLPVAFNALAYMLGLKHILGAVEGTPKAALSAVLASAVVGGVFNPKSMDWVGWVTGTAVAAVGANQGFAAGMVAWAV